MAFGVRSSNNTSFLLRLVLVVVVVVVVTDHVPYYQVWAWQQPFVWSRGVRRRMPMIACTPGNHHHFEGGGVKTRRRLRVTAFYLQSTKDSCSSSLEDLLLDEELANGDHEDELMKAITSKKKKNDDVVQLVVDNKDDETSDQDRRRRLLQRRRKRQEQEAKSKTRTSLSRATNSNHNKRPRTRGVGTTTTTTRTTTMSTAVVEDPLLSLNLNLNALVQNQAPDRAQELYQRILALYMDGYYDTAPDVVSFNTVLKGLQDNPSAALDFWHAQILPNNYDEEEEDKVNDKNDQADQRQSPKDEQQSLHSHSSKALYNKNNHFQTTRTTTTTRLPPLLEPNTRSFNTILLSLAKAGLYQPAMEVLRQMQELDSRVAPDCITYNTVLLAFAVAAASSSSSPEPYKISSGAKSTATTARNDPEQPNDDGKTTNKNHKIKSSPAAMAEQLLMEMMQHHDNKEGGEVENQYTLNRRTVVVKPNVISFNTVMAAWARQRNAERAEYWLRQLLSLSSTQQERNTNGGGGAAAALLSSSLAVLRPDAYSYTTVIEAWAKQENADRALALFQEMQQQQQATMLQQQQQQLKPMQQQGPQDPLLDQAEMETIMAEPVVEMIRPNSYTYTSVIRALCANRQPEKAQDLLQQIIAQATRSYNYKSDNNDDHDLILKNGVNGMHNYIDDDDGRLDAVAFSILIHGWSRVAHEQPIQAVERVLSLLQDMKRLSIQYPSMMPDASTYTNVLRTLARAQLKDGITTARTLMADLLRGEVQPPAAPVPPRFVGVEPTLIHFNAWMNVAAKAPVPNKALEAWNIYQDMLKHGFVGDSITFETLLSAAANAFGFDPSIRSQSWEIGRVAYAKLVQGGAERRRKRVKGGDIDDARVSRSSEVLLQQEPMQSEQQAQERQQSDTSLSFYTTQLEPSSLTFLNMMKLLRKFLPTNQPNEEVVVVEEWRSVISTCLDHGCLNNFVLQYIMDHAPPASVPPNLARYLFLPTSTERSKGTFHESPKKTTKKGRWWAGSSMAAFPRAWFENATPERQKS